MSTPPSTPHRLSEAARVQQVVSIFLTAVVVVALWPGTSLWWWVLLGLHPLTLAVEFALAAWGCRHEAARPPVLGWVGAWWWEWGVSARIFGWQQPWCSRAVPDMSMATAPAEPCGRRGVLLVHGYFCNRGIWNRWLLSLQHMGHPVMAVSLDPMDTDIDSHADTIEQAMRQLEQAGGLPPLVVAHSMGGLVVRAWMRAHAHADQRACHVVTIGTPHQGTWLAWFGLGVCAAQMRPHSAWLQSLAASEPPARAAKFTSWHALTDNIVMPAGTACFPGSEERRLGAVGHVALLDHPDVWADVVARLR